MPDDTTLRSWANLIQPEMLHQLLDHMVEQARQRKVTRGRKLRIDGTVVETNIHHPTDSTLERQRWGGRGRNWRAGIEGRISGLKRGHGLARCRYHGEDGMERWVGWGLITHDLHKIAQATVA